MRQLAESVFLSCALISFACGGGGGKGSPTAASPTPTSITVTSSSSMLRIGQPETFTASMAMSDGSSRPVAGGAWGGDAPAVANVEPSTGRVTGVGSGMVTVFVDYQGVRGTKLTRVVPDFQGVWSGSYAVESCEASGVYAQLRACDDFGPGRVLPANLNLTQSSDRVDGRTYLGTIGGDGHGPIDTGGELVISSGGTSGTASVESIWRLRSEQAGRITGALFWTMRMTGYVGDLRIQARIRDMHRSSSIVAPARESAVVPHDPRSALDAITRR